MYIDVSPIGHIKTSNPTQHVRRIFTSYILECSFRPQKMIWEKNTFDFKIKKNRKGGYQISDQNKPHFINFQ